MSTLSVQNQAASTNDFEPLEIVDFLIGEWVSEVSTPAGVPIKRSITYQWFPGRKVLAAESSRETGNQVISMRLFYLWDSVQQRIRTWVIGSDGSWSQALVDVSEDAIRLDVTGVTPEGYPISLISTLTRTVADTRSEGWTNILVAGNPQPSPPAILWRRK